MTDAAAAGGPRPAAKPKWGAWPSWPRAKRPPGATQYALALLGPALFFALGLDLSRASFESGAQIGAVLALVACLVLFVWFRRSRARALGRVGDGTGAGASGADADWEASRTGAAGSFVTLSPFVACVVATQLVWLAYTVLILGTRPPHEGKLVLFTLVGILVVTSWHFMFRRLWRGNAQVTFSGFPYVVGRPVKLFVGMTPGSVAVVDARYLLRCAGEAPAAGVGERAAWMTFWSEAGVPATDRTPGPDEFVELTFHPPAGLPGTSLHGSPQVRWELLVQCRTRSGLVSETFLVPVYAASAPAGPVVA